MATAVEFIPLSTSTSATATSATPKESLPYDISSRAGWLERMSLQTAHRLATVAIFAMVGSWVLVYRGQSDRWSTIAALAASDLGLCLALFTGLIARRDRRLPSRETMGLFVFNLVLVALSVQLMLFGRLDFIKNAIEQFFAPS